MQIYTSNIACSYCYKLVCFDDNFSKSFKTYLGKGAVYNVINNMIKESKYWSEVTKKRFNKELVITDNDVKLRDHCHVTVIKS